MADQVTKVTTESWTSRLSKSFAAIGGGVVLVIASIAGLAWNEHRAVQTATALTEGASAVLVLDADGYSPDVDDVVPNSEFLNTTGRLVWVKGKLKGDAVADLDLIGPGDAVPANATRLKRVVEMFQWSENQKSEKRNKIGGGTETVTTYTYAKKWSGSAIDSGRFTEPTGHQNPPMPVESKTFTEDRTLEVGESSWGIAGAYAGQLGEERALPLKQDNANTIRDVLKTTRPVTVSQGTAYFGYDPTRPQVGDFRISYRVATADEASVVGADGGNDLVPWKSSNGREIFIIRDGNVPASQMFDEEQKSNTLLTWGLRVAGFLAMSAGFRAILGFLGVLADVIPPLGSLVRLGTGLIASALTFILAPLTIGIAWLAVRPLMGGTVIVVGLLIAAGLWFLGRRRKQAAAPAVAAAS